MKSERTLSIIKPDAVNKNVIGQILSRFEKAGLRPVEMRMMTFSKDQAGEFYAVHKARPFYNDLVNYMITGPVVVIALDGPDAVALNRKLMGATNPKEATPGTIRADFADSIEANAVHGSDSLENAERELRFFFPNL
ncbi:MAG: nucleoside-diphosphate kinase [bacterium]|nr:nucleoside-diphosphate kinase [bacterium]